MPVSSKEYKRRLAQARRDIIDAINTTTYLDDFIEEEVFNIISHILKDAGLPNDSDSQDAMKDTIRITKPWASRRKGTKNGRN